MREIRRSQVSSANTVKPKKKKPVAAIVIGSLAAAVIVGGGAYCAIDRSKDKDTMGCKISIYGKDISWLTAEEAADKLQEEFQNTEVNFSENGKNIYKVSLKDAGYSLDRDALVKQLNDIKDHREPCKILFEKNKNFDIEYQIKKDDAAEKSAFANDKMESAEERVASVNAEIVFDDNLDMFVITPSTLGTQIDNGKLISRTEDAINTALSKDLFNKKVDVTIDNGVYQAAEVTEDSEGINQELDAKNEVLDNLEASEVTYTFGDVTETITEDMIKEWIVIENDEVELKDTAIRDYIGALAADYNTQYIPREFRNSHGDTIIIENNEYGYWIDEDAEYEQLIADLHSGEPVSREPVYKARGWKRNGYDDLVGGYVEVDLSTQHLWLYVDGEQILETDVVTGQPTGGINPQTGELEDRSTYEGSYPISYKESPAVLSSDIYGYEQPVDYWMPFVYGQGLHDANWRYSFGGNIYQWDGSHGCVNLPTYEASVIYSYVDENFPVILYKSGAEPEAYYEPQNTFSAGLNGLTYTTDALGNPIMTDAAGNIYVSDAYGNIYDYYGNMVQYNAGGDPALNGGYDPSYGLYDQSYGTTDYGYGY